MKKILTIILLVSFFEGVSQNLSKKEIVTLNELNITTQTLNLNDINVRNNLNKILRLETKRRTNKTVGIILTSASVASMVLGGILLKKENSLTDTFGTIMIAGGVVYGGISIPFWTSSKKRKRERDKLIKMFDK